ncbi:MAG: YegP family protein [Actinomycetes bacterium]|uniref:YegP family protein n=1 Tax=Arthrobacter subterraneus TaxID=335973 RepID=UPI0038224058
MAGRFELYFDGEKRYRFRLTGDDGATLVTSEPYDDKPTAVAGINGIRDCASTALISDLTDGDESE